MFGIRAIRRPDGGEDYQIKVGNEGVSTEVVIMSLCAYLDLLEKDYFDEFKEKSTTFKEK